MTADEHLSPDQFGFTIGSPHDWDSAGQQYGKNSRSGRLRLDTELHTGQRSIWPSRVQEYVTHPGKASDTGRYSPIEIYHHNGQVWAGEGHHRLVAAKIRGNKTIRVTFHGETA